jgi:hypothetical protein
VAEQERKTKAERRAEAREARKRAEEEAARQKKKDGARNAVITVAVIAVIAVVAIPAVMGLFNPTDSDVTISVDDAIAARQAASCETVVDRQPLPDSTHLDPAQAPPADVLYAQSQVRPTHSGPHYAGVSQPVAGIPSNPLDEVLLTHNLEHGSVIVWIDPDALDDGTVSDIESWLRARQSMGFSGSGGGAVFASPYDNFSDDRPVHFRAWGVAMNCESWDEIAADSFLIDNYGTNGVAPERTLSPYPTDALGYGDIDDVNGDDADGDDTGGDGTPDDGDDAEDE